MLSLSLGASVRANGPLCGPSRLPLEALLRCSLSGSAPVLTGSRRTPLAYPHKLPKRFRKEEQNIVYGYEPGQRQPKKLKRVVAFLAKDVNRSDEGKEVVQGKAGETTLVSKAFMRNHLVPKGEAYYMRRGKPMVYPKPFADWVPPEIAEQRLQARRDAQVLGLTSKSSNRPDLRQAYAQKVSILQEQIERQALAATAKAYEGGMTRAQIEEAREEGAKLAATEDTLEALTDSEDAPGPWEERPREQ